MRGRAHSAWRAASRPGLAAFAACRRGLTPPTTWLATPLGDRVCRDLGGKQGPSDLRCLGSPLQSWLGVCPRLDAIVLDSNITELSRGHSVVAMRCKLIIPLHSSTVVCHCSTGRALCNNNNTGRRLFGTHGLVAMTSAQHTEWRQFNPGWV